MTIISQVKFISEHCEVIDISETSVSYSETINNKQDSEYIGWMPEHGCVNDTIKRTTTLLRHDDGAELSYVIYNAGFKLETGDKIALLYASSESIKKMQLVGLRNFTRQTQTRFTNFDRFCSVFHPMAKSDAEEAKDKANQIGWAIASALCFLWIQSEEPLGNWWLNTGALFLMIGRMALISAVGGYLFRTPIAYFVSKLLSSGQKELIISEYKLLKDSIHQHLDDIPAFKTGLR